MACGPPSRRIRHCRRSGRYPRRAFPDDDDRTSGDSAACGGHARRAQPQRRRCAVVVVAGGARDRSRNPKARCDRTRRTAAAGAAADRAAAADGQSPIPEAALPSAPVKPEGRPRSAAASREEGGAAPADRARRQCAAGAGRRPAAGRAAAAADRCAARAGRRRQAEAASAAGADAAGRQSAAAFELAQDEIRLGRDDGLPCPRTQAARALRAGAILLCMGLFSIFCVLGPRAVVEPDPRLSKH